MIRADRGLLALVALAALIIPNASAQGGNATLVWSGSPCGELLDGIGANASLTFGANMAVNTGLVPFTCSWRLTDSTLPPTASISAMIPGEFPTNMTIKVSYCPSTNCNAPVFLGYAKKGEAITAPPSTTMLLQLKVMPGQPLDSSPITWGPLSPAGCNSAGIWKDCVDKYAHSYGCFRGIFTLPQEDLCFGAVTTNQCVEQKCMACDCANLNLLNIATQPHCAPVCGLSYLPPGRFCAPGCSASRINDTICQPECFNAACFHDGGDCEGKLEIIDAVFTSVDANNNGELGPGESGNLTANYGPAFEIYGPTMGGMVEDFVSLGFANLPLPTIDNMLDDMASLDAFTLGRAKDLVILADANLDGIIDMNEAQDAFDFDWMMYATVANGGVLSNGPPQGGVSGGITADSLGHTLFGIMESLSGRTPFPPFDHPNATKAIISLIAFNNGSVTPARAMVLGISQPLFAALDANDDGSLSEKELLDAQVSAVTGGCAGTTITSDREQVLVTKPPIAGLWPRKCSFLVLPTWFYPSMEEMPGTTLGGRRLLSVEQKEAPVRHSVVMKRKAGPAPNLLAHDAMLTKHKAATRRAKEATATAKSAKARRSSGARRTGDAATGDAAMGFVVSAQGQQFETWKHFCSGVLFDPMHVLVPAMCVAHLQSLSPSTRVVFADGDSRTITGYLRHPTNSVSVAILTLSGPAPATATPAQLHDGGGLDISECDEPIMVVGVHPGMPTEMMAPANYTWPGVFWQPELLPPAVSGMIVEPEQCEQRYAMVSRLSPLSDATVCVNGTPSVNPWTPEPPTCFGAGALMVVPNPENPAVMVVVGIQNGDCMSYGMPIAQIFTRVASALPWILSIPGMGEFPPLKLAALVPELSIPHGVDIRFYSGSVAMPQFLVGSINSTCDAGGTYYDTHALGSLGSMTIELVSQVAASHVDSSVTFDISPSECGTTTEGAGSNQSAAMCAALSGCMPNATAGTCMAPTCVFSQTWVDITRTLQKKGRAYTGGLGKDAQVTPFVEFRQWMCARDWDVEEQMMCGVGPMELACFKFDEMSSEFVFMGRNEDVKIVSAQRFADGVAKERMGMVTI